MNAVESAGTANTWLEYPTIRRRWDGLDEFSGVYFTDTPTTLSPGDNLPSPWSAFKCRDIEVTIEPDDTAELRVTGIGIYGSKSRKNISSNYTVNQEGFDEGTEVWIQDSKNNFTIGTQSTIESGMYVSDVTFDRLEPSFDYYRVTAKYRGILHDKDDKVHLSTAAREMGIQNVAVNLSGGWTDPRSGDILWPRPEVRVNYVTVGTPSQSDIPSAATPPVVPGVFNPTLSGDLKWHWPNGWVITARDAENLVGTNLWFVTEVYMFNAPATF